MRRTIHEEAPEVECTDVTVGLRDEELKVLHDATKKLPMVQRIILRCYFYEGMSKQYIAFALSVTRRRVKAYLDAALEMLYQDQLGDLFYEK